MHKAIVRVEQNTELKKISDSLLFIKDVHYSLLFLNECHVLVDPVLNTQQRNELFVIFEAKSSFRAELLSIFPCMGITAFPHRFLGVN